MRETVTLVVERRLFRSEFDTRSVSDTKTIVTGYAYKFDKRSQNLGGFRERVIEGAGADSITVDDIRALVNHEPELILGRNAAGTLRLAEDSTGLQYEIDADPRISYVRDLLISLERKDITQSSFGFEAVDDTWSLDEENFPLRSIRAMKLFDVSPVTYPAYTDTVSTVSSRALTHARELVEAHGLPAGYPELPEFDSEALAIRALMASLSLRG